MMGKIAILPTLRATLSVWHNEPVALAGKAGWYGSHFWLALRVDTGSSVVNAKSPEVIAEWPAESLERGRVVGWMINAQVEQRITQMDIQEALASFPAVLADLAKVE